MKTIFIDDLYILPLIFTCDNICLLSINYRDMNITSLFFNVTSLTSSHQILNKHTIKDIVCSKWTSHLISHLRLWCDIALRNPFSLNKINDNIFTQFIYKEPYHLRPGLFQVHQCMRSFLDFSDHINVLLRW